MKKIIVGVVCLCLILVSLSISYYFVVLLPRQQRANSESLKKIEQSTVNTERTVQDQQDSQPVDNSSEIQDQLDTINNNLQQQQDDNDSRNNCESNGGEYQGNGMCIYN